MKTTLKTTVLVLLAALVLFNWVPISDSSPVTGPADLLRALYAAPQARWPRPHVDPGVDFQELGPLEPVRHPDDNPYSEPKALLGKTLFFDPRMSASGTIACASCHDPQLGWGDGKSFSFGHERRQGGRNAMSILNAGYYTSFFWDGRATSLEHQALFPVQDAKEMNLNLDGMVKNIARVQGYRKLFKDAFQTEEVTRQRIQQALAVFERTVTSRRSAFDRFVGGDHDALSDEALLGLHLFRTKARCINCHNGALFSDNKAHNLGQFQLGRPAEDLGRFLITRDTADVGKFKTPSLRDVMFTGPWFHNGAFEELDEIIDMYERGMPQIVAKRFVNHPLNVPKSPLLKPLPLSATEKKALLAFLASISTRPNRVAVPSLPE